MRKGKVNINGVVFDADIPDSILPTIKEAMRDRKSSEPSKKENMERNNQTNKKNLRGGTK